MRKSLISNSLLTLGILMLCGFAVLEATGLGAGPLLPASAALCIGCTAVLDRVSAPQLR